MAAHGGARRGGASGGGPGAASDGLSGRALPRGAEARAGAFGGRAGAAAGGRAGPGGRGGPGASGGPDRPGATGDGWDGGVGAAAADPLIRICDLAGRPRGTGFLADAEGTLVTSHEAVDGLARLVLHAPGGQVCLVEAEAVTALPETGLALVATEGLPVPPLPVAPHGPVHPERRARLPLSLSLPRRVDATVLGTAAVTYTATDRFHLLDEVYELAVDDGDMIRTAPQTSGTPLLDAATGAVLGVVATALHAGHRAAGFAVPLTADGAPAPLAELLDRNAATVPAYGGHLNLAGALQLTGTSVGSAAGPGEWREPVVREDVAAVLQAFASGDGEGGADYGDGCGEGDGGAAGAAPSLDPPVAPSAAAASPDRDAPTPLVLGLVGAPGVGRTTELARLAAFRACGPHPAPTLWLRGAELRPGDGGLRDAVERALRTAARIVGAGRHPWPAAGIEDPSPDDVAGLAHRAGRPLLVLLDAPEEMPPVLAHALADWTAGTATWLRAGRVRLVVACRPEFWEQAGALLPPDLVAGVPAASPAALAPAVPPCLRLGDLNDEQAARARARHGLRPDDLAGADAAHPLALRLLSEVRAALPEELDPGEGERRAPPSRVEVFSAHLDLVCLRIAVRLAAASEPPLRGTAVRRLAARVAGQVHEAARRCLGPGQGELDREAFEELFPWRTGWASAVLTERLLVPAGAGYRFAHEEAADWLQALHLDLPAALYALVHRWFAPSGAATEAPVRLPSRPAAAAVHAGQPPPVPPAPALAPAFPRSLPVPHHRAAPVVQALLLASAPVLATHLQGLVHALDHPSLLPPRVPAPPPSPSRSEPVDLDADTVPNQRNGRAAAAPPRADTTRPQPVPRPASGPQPGAVPSRTPEAAPGPAHRPVAGEEGGAYGPAARRRDAAWWAAHLLRDVLLRVPDAEPYLEVLRALAGRIVVRSVERGGFAALGPGGLGAFGPWFWRRLPLPAAHRLDLLRLLLPADGPPHATGRGSGDRFLGAVSQLLRDEPGEAMAAVCGWFGDDRPLQGEPRLTVASAAQALLHTHRRLAVDDLADALVGAGRPAADDVLTALAEDEPSAVCRAVDRWAHDARPDRHVAAATYGARTAPHVRSDADRELLRYAALAILARPGDCTLHGAALGLLVRDPATRSRHLPAALRHFTDGDPALPPAAVAAALTTHPEPVLAAFQHRLRRTDGGPDEVLHALAEVASPALARRTGVLVQDLLAHRPGQAAAVAGYLDLRLEQGPGVRAVLLPLAAGLLRDHPAPVRAALVPVFAAPGSHLSRPLRQELLESVLESERDPEVLDALLTAAATGARRRHPLLTRDLVHQVALLLVRTPEGAALFDRRIVELAATAPDFACLVRAWLADGHIWDSLIGPSAHRTLATVP